MYYKFCLKHVFAIGQATLQQKPKAENFCLSHGKKLVSLSSLALSVDYTNTNGSGPLYQAFISVPNLKIDDKTMAIIIGHQLRVTTPARSLQSI